MSEDECPECRILMLQAGQAILAHMRAVNRLEEAVIQNAAGHVPILRERVLDTGLARENAVRAYSEHRADHDAAKTKTASSS